MRLFAVFGLGNFGSTVAVALADKGQSVLAVDLDPARVDEVRNKVTHAVVGDVTDPSFLSSVGISEVDEALVALGDDLEASVLTTLYLSESEVKHILVKGISEEHESILLAVGAHQVVFPENYMAKRLASSLAAPNIIDHIPLTEGYSIIELVTPGAFHHKSLLELNLRREYGVELLAIKRADPDRDPDVVVVPGAGEVIEPDDKLIILGAEKDVEQLQEL